MQKVSKSCDFTVLCATCFHASIDHALELTQKGKNVFQEISKRFEAEGLICDSVCTYV